MCKFLRDILALEDFRANIDVRRLQAKLPFLQTLLGYLLQFVKGFLAIAGLMSTSLRHATHPLQLRTIQVIGTSHLCPTVVDSLLAFLQIVRIVATIGIDSVVVQFKNDGAHPIQEETVVRHHQQGLVTTSQIAFQPFYHLQVQMVRGLVEYQQVRLRQQHVSQCHTLLLATTQFAHLLVQVANLQLRQHLFGLQHFLVLALMIETGIKHRLVRVECRRLFQHTHLQVATEHDATLVVTLFTREYGQKRRFTRTVLRYQSHLLAFTNRKTNVVKQYQRAERLRQVLYV